MRLRARLRSITLLSFFSVAGIVTFSAVNNYINYSDVVINNFVIERINNVHHSREYYRLKFDKLQHEFTRKESENIDKLKRLHGIYKRDKGQFDIQSAARELNRGIAFGSYQAFAINRNYVVEKSSYAHDLGYDLGQHKEMVDLFDSMVSSRVSIDVSPMQIDSASMQFKRYLIRLSDDGKYLLQVAFVLDFEEFANDSIGISGDGEFLDLYLANGNLIQPIVFESTKLKKKSLVDGWRETKTFLSELSADLGLPYKKKIAGLQALDVATDRLRINSELDNLFADEKVVHSLDLTKGQLSIYSITNGLFSKASETKLILKAKYSTENLERQLQNVQHHVILPLLLSLLALGLIYMILVRNILKPLLKIMLDMQTNRRSEVGDSIVTEIGNLRDSYNLLHDKLHFEIRANHDLLNHSRRCIADTIHQVRTPLTNIMMNSEMIKKMQQGDSLSCYIDRIDSSINMLSISYDDLAYVVTCDTIDYPPTSVNLSEVLGVRVGLFSTICEVTHRKINYLQDAEDIFIAFNEHELERIVDNNLSNGIKYADMHQPITVRLSIFQNVAVLEFSTHGREIVNKDRIFDEGYREDEGKRGFGLGLSMVKRICSKYNVAYSVSYADGQNTFKYQFQTTSVRLNERENR